MLTQQAQAQAPAPAPAPGLLNEKEIILQDFKIGEQIVGDLRVSMETGGPDTTPFVVIRQDGKPTVKVPLAQAPAKPSITITAQPNARSRLWHTQPTSQNFLDDADYKNWVQDNVIKPLAKEQARHEREDSGGCLPLTRSISAGKGEKFAIAKREIQEALTDAKKDPQQRHDAVMKAVFTLAAAGVTHQHKNSGFDFVLGLIGVGLSALLLFAPLASRKYRSKFNIDTRSCTVADGLNDTVTFRK
jgi:hypothetical protein